MKLRFVVPVAALAVAGILGFGAFRWIESACQSAGPSQVPVTVVIAKGTGLRQIADQLAQTGAVNSGPLFVAGTVVAGNPGIQAGEYAFPAHASMAAIIDLMHRGMVVEHRLTIPEGLTSRQIVALVDKAEAMRGGLLQTPADGSLLPQTYFYHYGEPRDALIVKMTQGMSQLLDGLWAGRDPDLPITDKRQAMILASIVERETALPAERPHVAAVFENRLRIKMKLKSDATVIYAASHGGGTLDHPISRSDLALVNPYNTYMNDGLPPGPISNPGRASIEAVLHPMASDDLYFVADGSGGHVFAKTLAQHNKNVERWRQLERKQGNGKGE